MTERGFKQRIPATAQQHLRNIEAQVDRRLLGASHPAYIHRLAHEIGPIMPLSDVRTRVRALVQLNMQHHRRPPGERAVFGTRKQWESVGEQVLEDQTAIVVPQHSGGWSLRAVEATGNLAVARSFPDLDELTFLYEASQTTRGRVPAPHTPRGLGLEVVAGDRIRDLLVAVQERVPLGWRGKKLIAPDGSRTMDGKYLEEGALDVAVSLIRSEIWGLPPDRLDDGEAASRLFFQNLQGATTVTELLLNAGSAYATVAAEAYRDVAGAGLTRPSRLNSAANAELPASPERLRTTEVVDDMQVPGVFHSQQPATTGFGIA